MNIDNLLRDLCPEGVKRVRLGEVCSITTGKLNANAMVDDGEYAFFTCSDTIYKIDNYAFDCEALLVAGNGYLGNVKYFKGKFNAYQRTYVLFDFREGIKAMYLFYCMKAFFRDYAIAAQKDGSVPYITLGTLQSFEIPLPPLPIQEAIVDYLDKLTSLTAELEAELELQKKRYDFYRNRLLSFAPDPTTQFGARLSNNGDYHKGPLLVKWAKLGDVFEMRNGYTPSKNNPAFWEGGTIPWFRMEDIRENGHILSDAIQHITAEAVKGKGLFEANSFILATTATIGEHALLIADSLANQRFTNLKIRKSLKDSFLTKFVFYYMFVVDDFCKKHTNKSGFESVDMEALRNMPFPLPPLSEQERIVGILDKYETLVNDTRQGIPALIAAVQRKYEYYRERLLTF